jgi:hypothetical protein
VRGRAARRSVRRLRQAPRIANPLEKTSLESKKPLLGLEQRLFGLGLRPFRHKKFPDRLARPPFESTRTKRDFKQRLCELEGILLEMNEHPFELEKSPIETKRIPRESKQRLFGLDQDLS